MSDAIQIKNLCKKYEDFHLENVSFSLPKGSIMGLIGENGAGKTTTIKAVLGLVRKDSGVVRILGHDTLCPGIREQIGVVFDESSFHDNLTATEVSKIMKKIYKSWNDAEFRSYLKNFHLPEQKTVKEFSRGMKMKLSMAVALAHHAKLLILDEATSGLDPVIRDEILDIFLDFIQEEECSILISSHIISDLDKVADYITFLHEGRVMFSEEKDRLLHEMAVLKCSQNDFALLDPQDVIRYRKNAFGVEVLSSNPQKAARKCTHAVVDPVSLEEIMLFYARGKVL